MKPFQFGKKQKMIWALCLLMAWGTVLFLFIRHNGGFSAHELAHYHPDRPFLSCLVMLGLFILKSVDFLIHSGVLYAANGIMFPLPLALLMNLVGIVITVIPTYFLGRVWGTLVVEFLFQKYPKLRVFDHNTDGGSILIAVLLRTAGLPIQVGSLYMGAAHYSFGRFLLGSLIGLLPMMVPYTIMGESVSDVRSPIFISAVVVETLICVSSFVICGISIRRRTLSKKT